MASKNPSKKPKEQQLSLLPAVSADLERLKAATRLMLDRLEEILAENALSDEKLAFCDRLFGPKQSMVATLVTLSELMLKLESSHAEEEVAEAPVARNLNDVDVKIVEEFVRRMKGS